MFAYVGGYTSKDRNGRGDGINVYRIDEASGAWSHVQCLGDLVNPSWLLLDRRRPVLYSAHGEGHEATAFAIEPATGRLRVLNRQPTQGKNGVRLGIEASDRFLVCANYSSGTVAVLPIEADGALGRCATWSRSPARPGRTRPSRPARTRTTSPSTRAGASAWCRTRASTRSSSSAWTAAASWSRARRRRSPAGRGRGRGTPASTRPGRSPTSSTSSTRR